MPFELIFFASISIYLFRILFFISGFFIEKKRSTKKETNQFEPFVSVVIAAKDEEENIERCVRSVANCNYPTDKYEIIVINDRSTDKTAEILEKLKTEINNLTYYTVESNEQKDNIPGKAGALHFGIQRSQGEIILVTDADCTVHPNWIYSHTQQYTDPDLGFVASFTYIKAKSFFEYLQSIEWIYMHTMAMGGIAFSQPLGCYGNNISFRRSAYDCVGGYKKIPFSVTEDLALQQAIHKAGYRVGYFISPQCIVETQPMKKFSEYIRQHHRWARGGTKLGWRAVIFVASSFAIWLGLILFSIQGNLQGATLIFLTRIIGDSLLSIPPHLILKKYKNLLDLMPSIIFFIIMELIVPFLLLKRDVKWKGQIIKS